jgi:hypothetical protein
MKSKLCYNQWLVIHSVSLSSTHLGSKTRFLLLSEGCGFVDVGCPLWWEDGSVVYNCCWPLSTQSFSGLSPTLLVTIFYCHRFKTPQTWRARSPYLYPPGAGWPSYNTRHWVPFPLPPRHAGLQWRYLNPPPCRVEVSKIVRNVFVVSSLTSEGWVSLLTIRWQVAKIVNPWNMQSTIQAVFQSKNFWRHYILCNWHFHKTRISLPWLWLIFEDFRIKRVQEQ